MKKLSLKASVLLKEELLTRGQLKKVFGGFNYGGSMCDSWATKGRDVCYNCCITVHDMSYCADKCSA